MKDLGKWVLYRLALGCGVSEIDLAKTEGMK